MKRGIIRVMAGGCVGFMCPGCREIHQVRVEGDGGSRWGFNGDYERPTFTPSVLVRGKQIERDERGEWTGEWVRDAAGNALDFVCHSFVTDGEIRFLGDCTHALAGQAVPIPDPGGEKP